LERVYELECVALKRLIELAKRIVDFGSKMLLADTEDMMA